MGEVNIVNNGKPYFFRFDIAKEGGMSARITDYLKTRVNDNGKKVPVKWFDQGQVMNVHGMSPFIQGGVGHYTPDEKNELLPGPDVVYRDWQGTPADVTDDGMVYYTLEDQFFCKQGQFKGVFGLRNSNGDVYTSVNIVFEILGNDLRIGETTKYYSSELEKMKTRFSNDTQQVIKDARNAYESETKNAHDSLDALKSQIQANRDEQNTLVERLIGVNQQIDANDIVKKYVYDDYVKKNEARLDATSQSITNQLKNLKLDLQFTTLNDLKTKYPDGSSGVYILENGNLAVYQNNQWSDSGKLVITNGANYRMFVKQDQIAMPYDDLNTLPTNSITVYGNLTIDNNPIANDSIIVLTLGPTEKDYQFNYACMQFVFGQNINDALCRMCWVNTDKTRSWKQWNKITKKYSVFSDQSQVVMPYDDLNTLPTNSITLYGTLEVKNSPWPNKAIYVETDGPNNGLSANYARKQTAILQSTGEQATRLSWVGLDGREEWKSWNKLANEYSVFSEQSQVKAPYDDLNTLPTNSITLYGTLEVKNSPWPNKAIYVETEGPSNDLSANYARKQTAISQSTGEQATRLSWVGLDGREEWKSWNKIEMFPSLSFLETFAVIGDSYSAGHLSDMKGGAISPTRFAWGNILAKDIGAKCVNLSVSGYTAYDWATNKISDLNKTPAQDLYVIALGINDALPSHDEVLGTIDDINDDPNKNANTFYGNYGKIISAIKQHDMNARIILLTIMTKYDSTSRKDEFNTAIKNIGAKYNIPVADLDQESYFASDDFNNLKNGGHPTIVGYSLMARALKHAIQKTIYQNNTYFDEWAKTMD